MNSTNDDKEKLKWGKWGDCKTKPEMKEFFELLLKYNNQTKKILEDTKEWLITNGNPKTVSTSVTESSFAFSVLSASALDFFWSTK